MLTSNKKYERILTASFISGSLWGVLLLSVIYFVPIGHAWHQPALLAVMCTLPIITSITYNALHRKAERQE